MLKFYFRTLWNWSLCIIIATRILFSFYLFLPFTSNSSTKIISLKFQKNDFVYVEYGLRATPKYDFNACSETLVFSICSQVSILVFYIELIEQFEYIIWFFWAVKNFFRSLLTNCSADGRVSWIQYFILMGLVVLTSDINFFLLSGFF